MSDSTKVRKRGRARIAIDKDQFEKLCGLMCTEEDIASWFHCSIETLNKWCKRQYGRTFECVRDEYQAFGRISLRRSQFEMAKTVPSMAIFLGKNYLGQSDDPRKYERDATTEDKLNTFIDILADAMTKDDDKE